MRGGDDGEGGIAEFVVLWLTSLSLITSAGDCQHLDNDNVIKLASNVNKDSASQ